MQQNASVSHCPTWGRRRRLVFLRSSIRVSSRSTRSTPGAPGADAEDVFVECLQAVADDPAVGAVAFCVDLTAEEKPDYAYSDAAFTVVRHTEKPLLVLSNHDDRRPRPGRPAPGWRHPSTGRTETGLSGYSASLDRHTRSSNRIPHQDSVAHRFRCWTWQAKPAAPPGLSTYGIPVPRFEVVGDEARASRSHSASDTPSS